MLSGLICFVKRGYFISNFLVYWLLKSLLILSSIWLFVLGVLPAIDQNIGLSYPQEQEQEQDNIDYSLYNKAKKPTNNSSDSSSQQSNVHILANARTPYDLPKTSDHYIPRHAKDPMVRVGLKIIEYNKNNPYLYQRSDARSPAQITNVLEVTLRMAAEKKSHFIVGSYNIETFPVSWVKISNFYKVRISLSDKSLDGLEKHIGFFEVSGKLMQLNNRTKQRIYNLSGAQAKTFFNQHRMPYLRVLGGSGAIAKAQRYTSAKKTDEYRNEYKNNHHRSEVSNINQVQLGDHQNNYYPMDSRINNNKTAHHPRAKNNRSFRNIKTTQGLNQANINPVSTHRSSNILNPAQSIGTNNRANLKTTRSTSLEQNKHQKALKQDSINHGNLADINSYTESNPHQSSEGYNNFSKRSDISNSLSNSFQHPRSSINNKARTIKDRSSTNQIVTNNKAYQASVNNSANSKFFQSQVENTNLTNQHIIDHSKKISSTKYQQD